MCSTTHSLVQLVLHTGEMISIYIINSEPIAVEVTHEGDTMLLPTVYALWLAPTLLPYFVTSKVI